MVTIVNPNNPLYRQHLYRGLSTDTKPEAKNGDVFQEMDTQTLYMFDEESLVWLEIVISESGEVVIVSGTAPVTLTDALAKGITRLVQYGKTVQSTAPTPSAPVDIVCNNGAVKWDSVNQRVYADGNPEVLTVSTISSIQFANIVDAKGLDSRTGAVVSNPDRCYTRLGYYSAGTTIVQRATGNKLGGYLYMYNSDTPSTESFIGVESMSTAVEVDGWYERSATSTSDGYLFIQSLANKSASLGINWSATQPLQTVTDIPMLLSVGDTKDEVEIISGHVTRKVGVKVFDGTEEFITGSNGWITEAVQDQSGEIYAPVCTHFRGINTAPVRNSNTIRCYRTSGGTGRIYFAPNMTTYATADDFKAFLAAQYANGTPVIVVYPLAEETAETVTAQPLSTNEGTNTVSVTTNVPVDLEVEYTKKVN